MIRLALAVALALALLGAAYGAGWRMGRVALQGRLDAAQVKADATNANDARELAASEQRRNIAGRQTEDAIHAATDLPGVCLPAGWLRAHAPDF